MSSQPGYSPSSRVLIAVLPGDGIGIEVTDAAIRVLQAALPPMTAARTDFRRLAGGAKHFADTGIALPPETLAVLDAADAIFFGAMGLPTVRAWDGTEVIPQIDLRLRYDLFAGVRPIRLLPGVRSPLRATEATDIDFVIVRESTEGMFSSFRRGVVEPDYAMDELRITRGGSERLFRFAFRLARDLRRHENRSRPNVALVDKANVLTSFAFFRSLFREVSRQFPDVETSEEYVDATALRLLQRPWSYDVLVTENIFGDILSDLAAGLVGGMGFAPSADIGRDHAIFQPSHGSAPDIAGKGIANPTAAILSGAMMYRWLAHRSANTSLVEAAMRIEAAVDSTFRCGLALPVDAGGTASTDDVANAILAELEAGLEDHPLGT